MSRSRSTLARLVSLVIGVTLALILAPSSAQATPGDALEGNVFVGDQNVNCTYTVLSDPTTSSNGTVQLGDGTTVVVSVTFSGVVTIPDEVTGASGTYGVTSIGNDAFNGCSKLTSITIPSSVTSIGDSAFWGCSKLESTGLSGNSAITSIGKDCFWECSSLTSTGLANNSTLTSMGKNCFAECTALSNTGLEHNTTLKSLSEGSFYGCTGLTSTGLADNSTVASVGEGCFASCTSIKTTGLEANATITSLDASCFDNCTGLTSTGLANNSTVKSMGKECFARCTKLVDAALGNGLTSTPSDPFKECGALSSVFFAGSFSTADGITLPHEVACYHLASDASWSGKAASDVSASCSSLKALSQVAIIGGTTSGTPSNPWKSAVTGETLWAQGETVSVTAANLPTGYKVGWDSTDGGGTFADATATTTTYTFGPSAGSDVTTLMGMTPITYEVAFDANGGAGTMDPETIDYFASSNLTANAFTRAGYAFSGWNTAADGSGTAYADNATVENLVAAEGATVTLYAQWTKNAASVTPAKTSTPQTGDTTWSWTVSLLSAAAGSALLLVMLRRGHSQDM